MNLLLGLLILLLLLISVVAIVIDITEQCRLQSELAEHEELLDTLWGED